MRSSPLSPQLTLLKQSPGHGTAQMGKPGQTSNLQNFKLQKLPELRKSPSPETKATKVCMAEYQRRKNCTERTPESAENPTSIQCTYTYITRIWVM